MSSKKNTRENTLRWLFAVPGRKKIYILFLIIAQSLHGGSGVLYALLLRSIVDNAAAHDTRGFWKFLFLIVLLAAAQQLLRALIRWLTELSKATLENCFKERLMKTLLHKDFASVNAVHSGEWMNRLTNDTMVVANYYVEILPGLSGMVIKLIGAITMILVLEPRFAVILFPGGACMIVFTWLFRRYLKRLHKAIQEADGRLRVFLQERIGSMMMIRSFAAEERTMELAAQRLQDHLDARMRRNHFSNFCNIGFSSALNGLYLLGVGWCGYGILQGTITFGTLTAITQLITQIQAPFVNITGYLPKYYAMLASAERLMEAESLAEEYLPEYSLPEILHFYKEHLCSFGMRGVSFTYYPPVEKLSHLTKERMATSVENFSIEIRKGEYVALTGISGSGKSTALKLLMCVYQPEGERFYTDTNGKTETLTSAYRRLFAYVPQGNQLMSGTIREIVSFADPASERDEERIQRALSIACAADFVEELEKGVDTLLGERGQGLSEGQMQRIAIARAVFSESPVLLLDEATSALDEETEVKLLRNLRTMTDHTVLIVTHRKKALTICDREIQISPDR